MIFEIRRFCIFCVYVIGDNEMECTFVIDSFSKTPACVESNVVQQCMTQRHLLVSVGRPFTFGRKGATFPTAQKIAFHPNHNRVVHQRRTRTQPAGGRARHLTHPTSPMNKSPQTCSPATIFHPLCSPHVPCAHSGPQRLYLFGAQPARCQGSLSWPHHLPPTVSALNRERVFPAIRPSSP